MVTKKKSKCHTNLKTNLSVEAVTPPLQRNRKCSMTAKLFAISLLGAARLA